MSNRHLTDEQFKSLIASYGANALRWPEAEYIAMNQYLKAHPEKQPLLDQAKGLDTLLNFVSAPKAIDEGFLDQLTKLTPPKKQASFALGSFFKLPRFNLSGFMPRAVGLASVCALGIVLGLSNFARENTITAQFDPSAIMFGSSSLDNDLKELD